MLAYKATDKDMKCRGFQFGLGQLYIHDGSIDLCKSGFHACETFQDVFLYYPAHSRVFIVELGGETKRAGRKIVASEIKFLREIPSQEIKEILHAQIIKLRSLLDQIDLYNQCY